MANIVNNFGSNIVTIFQTVVNTYEADVKAIKQIEEELNDINHEIELGKPKNAAQGYKLYQDIRKLRNKRRTLKEEVELLADTYEYFNSQQGQAFKNKVQALQGGKLRK